MIIMLQFTEKLYLHWSERKILLSTDSFSRWIFSCSTALKGYTMYPMIDMIELYYSDVTWAWYRLKSQITRLFVQKIVDDNKNEIITTPKYWPFPGGESISEWYRKTPDISRTSVGNKIVDNSDVVGASPVGAAPTTSSFLTQQLASMDWARTTARGYK